MNNKVWLRLVWTALLAGMFISCAGVSKKVSVIDDFASGPAQAWKAWGPGGGTCEVADGPEGRGKCLVWRFDRTESSDAAGLIRREVKICDREKPSSEYLFRFRIRGHLEGRPSVALHFHDSNKTTWCSPLSRIYPLEKEWRTVTMKLKNLFYVWGTETNQPVSLSEIVSFGFTVSQGQKGILYLDDLAVEEIEGARTYFTNLPLDFGKEPLSRYGHDKDLPSADPAEPAPIKPSEHIIPGRPSRVVIRPDHITEVNGKPFFPVGIFCVPRGSFAELRRAGYNAIMEYRGFHKRGTAVNEYLDLCMENGMMALVDVQDFTKTTKDKKADLEGLAWIVDRAKRHPALLGWYIADEPEYGEVPREEYVKAYELINRLDPDHPVIMLNNRFSAIHTYADAGDILMPDPYPGFLQGGPPYRPIDIVWEYVDEAICSARKAVWVTPQLHNGLCYKLERGEYYGRTPTISELRYMTYTAVVHGARGFFYWCFAACRWDIRDTPKYCEAVKALIEELSFLTDVICMGNGSNGISPASEGAPIKLGNWELDEETYTIAVNDSDENIRAKFVTRDLNASKLLVISEDRHLRLGSDGSFDDLFKPRDVHIYTTASSVPDLALARIFKEYVKAYSIAGTLSPTRERNRALYLNGATVAASTTNRYARATAVINGAAGSGSRWLPKDACPQWISVTFPKQVEIGRAVVTTPCDEEGISPLENANYELQYRVEGTWETMEYERKYFFILWNGMLNRWERSDNYNEGCAKALEHTFPATPMRELRLHIESSSVRACILEIEAYE